MLVEKLKHTKDNKMYEAYSGLHIVNKSVS